jgi:hypothetical protein
MIFFFEEQKKYKLISSLLLSFRFMPFLLWHEIASIFGCVWNKKKLWVWMKKKGEFIIEKHSKAIKKFIYLKWEKESEWECEGEWRSLKDTS